MFEKFLRSHLKAAERESLPEELRWNMEALVPQGSLVMEELADQMGGRRNPKKHQHHSPKDLTEAVIENIVAILEVRRQIDNEK